MTLAWLDTGSGWALVDGDRLIASTSGRQVWALAGPITHGGTFRSRLRCVIRCEVIASAAGCRDLPDRPRELVAWTFGKKTATGGAR